MKTKLDEFQFKNPRFLLMYSALQFGPEEMAKPDGSLSLPYLAGAIREAGYDVKILDVSVGDKDEPLEDSFFNTKVLPSGLIRCGMTPEKIVEQMADFDVIGISSIFTTQTTMVLDLIRLAKRTDPSKLVIAGGVNARNMRDRFFKAGVDLIVLSEAERIIVQIAERCAASEAFPRCPASPSSTRPARKSSTAAPRRSRTWTSCRCPPGTCCP
ncbi:MAG: cobalamin B12-binding domain-containing protein [Betaproteobacteria bacterium]|nr:cobalamin B12-binding domain-containing protein [Betaproteobacteria bacterium]